MEPCAIWEFSGSAGGAGCAVRRFNWNRIEFVSRPVHLYQPKSNCLLTKLRNAVERSERRAIGGQQSCHSCRLASAIGADVSFHTLSATPAGAARLAGCGSLHNRLCPHVIYRELAIFGYAYLAIWVACRDYDALWAIGAGERQLRYNCAKQFSSYAQLLGVVRRDRSGAASRRAGAGRVCVLHVAGRAEAVSRRPAGGLNRMSSPNRLQQIEDIFHAALEREPSERDTFLAEACAGDQALLDAVNDLLAAHDQSWSLVDQRHAAIETDNTSDPTRRMPRLPAPQAVPSPAPHSSNDGQRRGRFVTGQMLAGRYRIVSLLGRGGMGEVYKAEDLKLNQTVALKFLPSAVALDGGMLARFHNEVRIARQIAHPHVCRVYDIGEVEGMSFLSMEFIDGEDLSSLLRRIGRLPADKAVELARQLCAGLAAAHEAGVLHRDLKPANVMIDGRGKARITDFGLAVVSEELCGEEAMAGTPAYMAPEQLTRKEVTQRSDIYALGLTLYELFTGKRVFEAKSIQELISLHEKSTPPTPSSHVKDIDPLAERVILRCLEKDPKARPASAVQVALALPGGDPLQAALALGETPSPEMVAAAGANTGLRPAAAVACLLAVVIGLVTAVHFRSKTRLVVTPFEHPPEFLSGKAREIIAQLGYPERPADSAHGFGYDHQY